MLFLSITWFLVSKHEIKEIFLVYVLLNGSREYSCVAIQHNT